MNALLVSILEKEAGLERTPVVYDDLDPLIGTWVKDPKSDRALRALRKVDPRDWETD